MSGFVVSLGYPRVCARTRCVARNFPGSWLSVLRGCRGTDVNQESKELEVRKVQVLFLGALVI